MSFSSLYSQQSLVLHGEHTRTHTLLRLARPSQRVPKVIIRTLWEYLLCRTEPSCHLCLLTDRLTSCQRSECSPEPVGRSALCELTKRPLTDGPRGEQMETVRGIAAQEKSPADATNDMFKETTHSHHLSGSVVFCVFFFFCIFHQQPQPQPPPQPVRIIPSQSAQPTSLPKPVPSVQHAARPPRPPHTPHAASLPTCPGRGKMAKFLSPDEMTSRDYYFDSYAHFGIHEVATPLLTVSQQQQ